MSPALAPRFRRCAALAGLLLAGWAGRAQAADPAEPLSAEFQSLVAGLKAPADPAAVDRLLAAPEASLGAGGLAAAGALWHAGGAASAVGLCRLVRHADSATREAALRGLIAVNLRVAGVSEVRRALRDRDRSVRVAAYDALGVMGDATDVPTLIQALEREGPDVRSLALRTLRAITHQPLPANARRWLAWWEQEAPLLAANLSAAVEVLETVAAGEAPETSPEQVEQAWGEVQRQGWVGVQDLVAQAKVWLRDWTPAKRELAYRVATVLRLADLAEPIRSAARMDRRGEIEAAARGALLALGLESEARSRE